MMITVFGEILWDVFGDDAKIGGAPFNFVAHCVRQGADVNFISAVGNDDLGDKALVECRQMNIPAENIAVTNYPTGRAIVTLENGTPTYDLSGEMAYDHIPMPEKSSAKALYFGTLAQRSDESCKSLEKLLAHSKFDEVFLDINIRQSYYTDDILDWSIKNATILKMSRDDMRALNIYESEEEFCRDLAEKYPNLKMIIVTLDSDGAFVYEKDGKITRSEKPDCEVVSTVGAGDAFSAAFLVNYLDGRSVAECLKEAIRLASYVCTFVEAVPTFPMDDIRKWRAIYRLLNMVETEVYDCGELCGNACCMCRESSEDMGIYLLPGEHLILRESEGETSLDNSEDESWLTWEQQAPEDIGFPTSWGGPVYFVKCKTPPMCPRKYRPLQCRTFPLKPIIDENGVLEMIWEDSELPYICPIIEQNLPIHDSFYKATYTAWKHLLQDRRIMELVLSWSD